MANKATTTAVRTGYLKDASRLDDTLNALGFTTCTYQMPGAQRCAALAEANTDRCPTHTEDAS
jgi:hypothetical protein